MIILKNICNLNISEQNIFPISKARTVLATKLNVIHIYPKVVKSQTVDGLRYTILLEHSLRKRHPSWDVSHLFLLLVLAIIMYCSIPRITFLQIFQVLCNMF